LFYGSSPWWDNVLHYGTPSLVHCLALNIANSAILIHQEQAMPVFGHLRPPDQSLKGV